MKIIYMPIHRKADEWTVEYQYMGLVYSSQNEWTAVTHTNMNEFGDTILSIKFMSLKDDISMT